MSNNSDSDSAVGERHSIANRRGRRKRTAEPDSDDQSTRRQRRRRHSPQPDPQDDDDDDDNDDDDQDHDSDDSDGDDDNGNNGNGNDDEYDPDQPLEERRRVQRALREQQKQMRENSDEYLQEDPAALLAYFTESALTFRNVKQTAEAAIDSRGLVIAADLSARRVQRLTAGMGAGNGIDVDEFVSKCITYMLHRGESDNDAPLSGTQRQRDLARQQTGRSGRGAIGSEDEDEDEENEGGGGDGDGDEDGDMRDWSHLGRHACVPSVRRPAVPGFLLGPLSVEKKVRKITKRTAPLRLNQLEEVRPQELRAEDLKRSEAGNVPNVCKKIYEILNREYRARMDKFEQDWDEDLAEDSPENLRVFERHALRQDGGLCLIRFVVNPKSFGQTVENLFYTSFLIKDRRIKLSYDVDGLPSITPVSEEDRGDDKAKKKEVRHQAIISLDMAVWRDMIDVFHITTPIIPHRREEPQEGPGERGWY